MRHRLLLRRLAVPFLGVTLALCGTSNAAQQAVASTNNNEMEFVRIPAGSFLMGCSPGDSYCEENEKPVHRVTISKAFELGKYLVTQEQYQAVMGTNPSQFKGDRNLPVDSATWNDAQEFVNRMNARQD